MAPFGAHDRGRSSSPQRRERSPDQGRNVRAARRLARLAILTAAAAVAAACGAGGADDEATRASDASTVPEQVSPSTEGDGVASTSAAASTGSPTVATTGTAPQQGREPVFAGDFPDPFVLPVDGAYYAYATQGSYGNVQLLRGTDLSTWELQPLGAMPEIPEWAAPYSVWAPAVVEHDGRFVMYYSVTEAASALHCVSVATSDDPEGPFTDVRPEPLVCPREMGGAIDPSPVVDREGRPWLLWKSDGVAVGAPSAIYAQPMTDDRLELAGDPVLLIGTDQPWEAPHVEAPSMIDAGDHYVLVYSGNWWNTAEYGVGAAICATVAGPCTKPLDGPILTGRADAAGPGGAELFRDADGAPWVAYHAWLGGVAGYPGRRALWIEPVDLSGEVPALG